jgi:hypothetical protein
MKQFARWAVLLGSVLLLAPAAGAQCAPILCSLTIVLQSDASGLALGGSGSNTASMAFNTMQAYGGSVPTGVTRVVGTSNWTVATKFDVKVNCLDLLNLLNCTGLNSPSYTLTAQLQSADSINTWQIGASTLSSASATTLSVSGPYFVATAYTLSLVIPFTETARTISNTVNFVVTAN